MKSSFTKLKSGDWGVRVEGIEPAEGGCVPVSMKDGSIKSVVVDRIIWSKDGVYLCTVRRNKSTSGPTSSRRTEEVYRRKYGWDGVRGSSSYYSSGMYDEES